MLKLRAKDAEDVQVVSAVLQDAIVPSVDMAYQAEEKAFFVVAQRLRREEKDGACERICCAMTVRGVEAVRTHGLDLNDQEMMLDLLALMLDDNAGKPQLTLVFAADMRVRLDLGAWSVTVEDFGEAWPALCHPDHKV